MARSLKSKLDSFDPQRLSELEHVGFDSNRKRRSLPPLQTLIAFEAAARLQSFTLAASELNLTQPAISQQVKFLEERLDISLFQRSNNRITLTEKGESLGGTVSLILDQLAASVDTITDDASRSALTISMLPSFASTLFSTRAVRFQQQHPHIDLITLSTVAKTGFGQEDADIAIRWGPGGEEAHFEEKILSEHHILVAASTLAAELQNIQLINDLAALPFFTIPIIPNGPR